MIEKRAARMIRQLLVLAVICSSLTSATVARGDGLAQPEGQSDPLDARVFATVGAPGHPDPIAVDGDRTIYVGTLTSLREMNLGRNDSTDASTIFAYRRDGTLRRQYPVAGQRLNEEHGVLGIALDADGLLYVTDANPARVFALDPRTGSQRDYATFRNVEPCSQGGPPGDCSAETVDRKPLPNGAAFGRDGSLYVADYRQALIWRVPAGGGQAQVWLTDPQLDSYFGPNGIRLMADRSTLLFTQTNTQPPAALDVGFPGRLYTLPIRSDGTPGELSIFYESRPLDGPDSFAVASSGNVYVALAGSNQLLKLSPTGTELARASGPARNDQGGEIAFDVPADVAFIGERVLVTNSSFILENPVSWAVFDVFAGEPGLRILRPRVRVGA
jgi:sugar lactone lactonase YvrE